MKAVICPVCNGTGKYTRFPDPSGTNAAEYEQICHGCGGKGYVVIPEKEEVGPTI